jgi:hypothetical protein
MFPTSVLGWMMIVAAWAGALAFSVFMTTLSLAVLRWNFARIKWPLVVSGVVMLLAGTVIAAGGPIVGNELDARHRSQQCQQMDGQEFQQYTCGSYMMETQSL